MNLINETNGELSLKLKRSFYNIKVRDLDENKYLLFNSITCAFGILNKEGKNIYDNIEDIHKIDNDKDKNILQTLFDNGFVIDNDLNEYDRLTVMMNSCRYNPHTINLTIATTIDCNMACPYCFESKKKEYMSKTTADNIIDFIQKLINNDKINNMFITWYGGEPLLNKEIIEYLTPKMLQICDKEKIGYRAHIVTNGVLLDRDTAKMLSDNKVKTAQVTIDGLKEIHNKRRIMKNGSDSFSIIMNNIINCKDIIDIVVRCNIDKDNLDETHKMIEYFKENGIRFYFAPIMKSTDSCNIKNNVCFTNSEFSSIETNLLREIYKNEKTNKNIPYPTSKVISCASIGMNSWVIDPLGNLCKCWEEVGCKEKIIGDVKTGESFCPETIKWLSYGLKNECIQCKILPLCMGGCPAHSMQGKQQCFYQATNFKEKLELFYEHHINNLKQSS